MAKDLSGVFTALVTPFKNGAIDWASMKRLLEFQKDVDGFVVSGTTGESPTLSDAEKREIFDFVRKTTGKPIIVGTGTNSTDDTVEATKAAAAWGADAALVVVPYYNKPPQRGLFAHFQKVSECSSLPVVLYNVPGRTITKLEVETIKELSRLPNIIGIKEATGDVEFGRQVAAACSPEFLVTSGDDGTFLDLIPRGSRGVISVASHILPTQFADWCRRARKGDETARVEFSKYSDLNNYLYVEANPIPVKMALKLMGIIDSAELRLPLVQLSEPYTAQLREKMLAVGLL